MDEEKIIRPDDIAITIQSNDIPPRVDTDPHKHLNHSTTTDRIKHPYVFSCEDITLHLPERGATDAEVFHASRLISNLYMHLPEAINDIAPTLVAMDPSEIAEEDRDLHEQLVSFSQGDMSVIIDMDLERAYLYLVGLTEKLGPQHKHKMRVYRVHDHIQDRDSSQLYRDAVVSAIAQTEKMPQPPLSLEESVKLHEHRHLADLQDNAGKLVRLDRQYQRLMEQANGQGNNMRLWKLSSLIADTLEARAYIAQYLGRPVQDDKDNGYSHAGFSDRLLQPLRSVLRRKEQFTVNFMNNDPLGRIDQSDLPIHDEHDGGALLLAFIGSADIMSIVEDGSYRSLVDLDDDASEQSERDALVRAKVAQRIVEIVSDAEEGRKVLMESWDKLSELLEKLGDEFEIELQRANQAPA